MVMVPFREIEMILNHSHVKTTWFMECREIKKRRPFHCSTSPTVVITYFLGSQAPSLIFFIIVCLNVRASSLLLVYNSLFLPSFERR